LFLNTQDAGAEVSVLATSQVWMEGSAIEQLRKTAKLEGMLAAIGMPDLHPGANSPIGAVFVSRDRIYPALVGNDIGCGVGLWQTDLQLKKNRLGDWAERLRDLDGPWAGDGGAWLAERDIEASEHDHSLGTIGAWSRSWTRKARPRWAWTRTACSSACIAARAGWAARSFALMSNGMVARV
jgi:hypothetical protein